MSLALTEAGADTEAEFPSKDSEKVFEGEYCSGDVVNFSVKLAVSVPFEMVSLTVCERNSDAEEDFEPNSGENVVLRDLDSAGAENVSLFDSASGECDMVCVRDCDLVCSGPLTEKVGDNV